MLPTPPQKPPMPEKWARLAALVALLLGLGGVAWLEAIGRGIRWWGGPC